MALSKPKSSKREYLGMQNISQRRHLPLHFAPNALSSGEGAQVPASLHTAPRRGLGQELPGSAAKLPAAGGCGTGQGRHSQVGFFLQIRGVGLLTSLRPPTCFAVSCRNSCRMEI